MIENNKIFINPDGSNKTEIKAVFDNATNLLLDFLAAASNKAVLPSEDNFGELNFAIPDIAFNEKQLQQELTSVLNMSMNPANPTYIGHMDSLPTAYSIIGSLFSAALNNNMFSLEMSPYFTRLEYSLIKQFSQMFGLPATASGLIMSGGTLSNVQAILTARNYFLKSNDGNISKSKGKMVLFASEHSHVSIKKAAMISGLGTDSLITVSADSNGKMNIQDLELKITKAINKGQQPFAVIATLGTTVTGNIDPIEEVAEICRKHNIWFHADAIYGGAIVLSKKEKHRLKGIERADSISFNPQKWMHISKTCSLLMFRDSEMLTRYFTMKAYYTKEQNKFINLSELSIQGTRHADILKLWLSIISVGLSGYEKMINDSYAITEKFVQALARIPVIEFPSSTEMNIPTFRLTGPTEYESNKLNREFNEYAISEHNIFFSLPTYNNKLWQRTILLNPFINESVIDKVVTAVNQFCEEKM